MTLVRHHRVHGGGVYGCPDGVYGGDVDRGAEVRRGLGHGEQQGEGDGEHGGAAAQEVEQAEETHHKVQLGRALVVVISSSWDCLVVITITVLFAVVVHQ